MHGLISDRIMWQFLTTDFLTWRFPGIEMESSKATPARKNSMGLKYPRAVRFWYISAWSMNGTAVKQDIPVTKKVTEDLNNIHIIKIEITELRFIFK